MREHDVAGLEASDRRTDGEHLADGRVAGEDQATAGLGDVDGVGDRRVVHVVLARDREDLEVNVVLAGIAELVLAQLHDPRDVEVGLRIGGTRMLCGDVF